MCSAYVYVNLTLLSEKNAISCLVNISVNERVVLCVSYIENILKKIVLVSLYNVHLDFMVKRY